MGATSDHIVETSTSRGLSLALPLAVQAHHRRAIENGHGSGNEARITAGVRRPRRPDAGPRSARRAGGTATVAGTVS
ncbi:hypothetical protein [Streptomyces althioticus]|uniref:imine reductase family protein n=1 Tax=Streptomyces althioticus TaxID=83380 RepID=UPI0036C42E07